MRFVVTGCAGFIGSSLCEKLIAEGNEVVGIDCLTDYYNTVIKHNNIAGFKDCENFTFIQSDIKDLELNNVIQKDDIIYHLAAQPGVRSSWGKSFEQYIDNNILVSQRILEASKEKNIKKLVYASSSSVYGNINKEVLSEDLMPAPNSPYGVSKLAAENLCSLYEKNYDMPVVSMRFFTVYGPKQRPDMAFYRIIKAGITGTEFTLFGDGSQERDFTFISDIIRGLLMVGTNPNVRGVFNIGGGKVVSMNEVISIIEDLMQKKINIVRQKEQLGDVKRTSADLKRIKSLGYTPDFLLREGLLNEILYLTKNQNLL